MLRSLSQSSLTGLSLVLGLASVAAQGPPPAPQPAPAQQPAPAPPPPAAPAPPMPWRPLPSPVPEDSSEEAVAIHVKRAITVSGEPIDDATILVRGGKIAAIGKIVDVPKGARRLDYGELTAMPGLVVAFARAGYQPRSAPQGAATKAKDGIDPEAEIFRQAARAGVTTMAVVPQGAGIVGLATVLRTWGGGLEDRVKRDEAYLFSVFEMNSASKELFRTSFQRAKEAMEQFEKAQKEAAQPAPASAPGAAPATQPAPAPPPGGPPATQPAAGAPPAPKPPAKLDPKVEPLVKVLKREKRLLTQLGGMAQGVFFGFGGSAGAASPAAEVLHFHEAMKDFDIDRIYLGGANFALVAEKLAQVKAIALLPTEEANFVPYSRSRLNGAAELLKAGVKVALLPPGESREGYQNWLYKLGQMVKMGLSEKDALRAVTLTPAELLGLGEQSGALAPGRDADILFLDGPPLEATTRLRHVMAGGELLPEDEQ